MQEGGEEEGNEEEGTRERLFTHPALHNLPSPVHSLTLMAEVSFRRTSAGGSRNSEPSVSVTETAFCSSSKYTRGPRAVP